MSRRYSDQELEDIISREIFRSNPHLDDIRKNPLCLVGFQLGRWHLLAPLSARLPDGSIKSLSGKIKVPYLARSSDHLKGGSAKDRSEYQVVKVLSPDTDPPRLDEESNVKNRAPLKWILYWYGSLANFVHGQSDLFQNRISHGNIQPVIYSFDKASGLYYCEEPVGYADLRHWAINQYFSIDKFSNLLVVNRVDKNDSDAVEKARASKVHLPVTLDESIKYYYATALIEALAVCHQGDSPEVHGDIKPANIMIERRKDHYIIKLADFDVFTDEDHFEEAGTRDDIMIAGHQAASFGTMDVSTCATHTSPKGTYDDVFAMAKTLYYLFTGDSLSQYEGRNLSEENLLKLRHHVKSRLHAIHLKDSYRICIEMALNDDIKDGVQFYDHLMLLINKPVKSFSGHIDTSGLPDRVTVRAGEGKEYEVVSEQLDSNAKSNSGVGLIITGIVALAIAASSFSSDYMRYFRAENSGAGLHQTTVQSSVPSVVPHSSTARDYEVHTIRSWNPKQPIEMSTSEYHRQISEGVGSAQMPDHFKHVLESKRSRMPTTLTPLIESAIESRPATYQPSDGIIDKPSVNKVNHIPKRDRPDWEI